MHIGNTLCSPEHELRLPVIAPNRIQRESQERLIRYWSVLLAKGEGVLPVTRCTAEGADELVDRRRLRDNDALTPCRNSISCLPFNDRHIIEEAVVVEDRDMGAHVINVRDDGECQHTREKLLQLLCGDGGVEIVEHTVGNNGGHLKRRVHCVQWRLEEPFRKSFTKSTVLYTVCRVATKQSLTAVFQIFRSRQIKKISAPMSDIGIPIKNFFVYF